MTEDNFAKMAFALKYLVNVRSLPLKGIRVTLTADARDCKKLAENHDLKEVISYNAEFQVFPWKKRGVRLKGQLKASIVQTCIATLKPIDNTIDEKIEVFFVPDDSRLAKPKVSDETGELFVDVEGPDTPEIFQGDSIDVGAVTEEFFELAIDPYPRIENFEVHLPAELEPEDKEIIEKKISPFAILKQLK